MPQISPSPEEMKEFVDGRNRALGQDHQGGRASRDGVSSSARERKQHVMWPSNRRVLMGLSLAALAHCDRAGESAGLSEPACHHRAAARGRRSDGHHRAVGWRKACRSAGQAGGHREPYRRRHGDRGERGREGAARRLHAALRAGRHVDHQRDALQASALRSGQGLRAGGADLQAGLRHGGQSVARRWLAQGVRQVRQGQRRQGVLRIDRHRRHAALWRAKCSRCRPASR